MVLDGPSLWRIWRNWSPDVSKTCRAALRRGVLNPSYNPGTALDNVSTPGRVIAYAPDGWVSSSTRETLAAGRQTSATKLSRIDARPQAAASQSLVDRIEIMAARKLKQGDIFDIPSPDGRKGFGQIVVAGKTLYVVVFLGLRMEAPTPTEIVGEDILLTGWTVDALIHHGRWSVVGNHQPRMERIPFPNYKVVMNGVECVRDFFDTTLRPATAKEAALLDHQTTVAPIRYQKAFLAHYGFGEWLPEFEPLMAKNVWQKVLPSAR